MEFSARNSFIDGYGRFCDSSDRFDLCFEDEKARDSHEIKLGTEDKKDKKDKSDRSIGKESKGDEKGFSVEKIVGKFKSNNVSAAGASLKGEEGAKLAADELASMATLSVKGAMDVAESVDVQSAALKKIASEVKDKIEGVLSSIRGLGSHANEASGDAMADGKAGAGALLFVAGFPYAFAAFMCGPFLLIFALLFIALAAIIIILMQFFGSFFQVGATLSNYISLFPSIELIQSLEDEEIEDILSSITLSENQEIVVSFALSKVGYPYSQLLRTSGYCYDCSSFVYYALQEAGYDISFGEGYPPTAAEEARMLVEAGLTLSLDDEDSSITLMPGDLIFYGGKDNGRYLGIYHVALYVGQGCCVEALSTKYGVVYQTLRTDNAVLVARIIDVD